MVAAMTESELGAWVKYPLQHPWLTGQHHEAGKAFGGLV
jgi:hypothetical protein